MADIDIVVVIVLERGLVLIRPGRGFGKVAVLGDVFLRRGGFFLHGGIFIRFLLVAGEGDIGACFEELFPELYCLCVSTQGLDSLVSETGGLTLAPSQTSREFSAYCSTTGRMLVVTIRWAWLKLWSISRQLR